MVTQNSSSRGIKKLLVANRGEIATRIFRTCRRLGIKTVAVFSDADRYALHTRSADERIYIGASEASASYLSIPNVIAAITQSGADAVHPGYGFLSENGAFSSAVEGAGSIFLGPTAAQMSALGDKEQAKEKARSLAIPVLESARVVEGAIPAMAFPLMIKARAGGGGRGMRIVRKPEDFPSAAQSAAREAQSFFNDGTLFVERFIERARHVEVQLLGDGSGAVMAIGDRDCSVQRRHQKVLEEAPAFGLSPELRKKLHSDSERLLASVAYRGAGTAEFLVTGDEYFFLEVNTRLQVEHPVTEAVTGLDLVELQIRIGAGQLLKSILPCPIPSLNHSIELRLCAERPSENFAPATGTLAAMYPPHNARLDAGFEALDTVSHYYDSLIAKIIVSGASRAEVIANAQTVLNQPIALGIETNQRFLRQILTDSVFERGEHFTRWVETLSISGVPTLAEAIFGLQANTIAQERALTRSGFPSKTTYLAPMHGDVVAMNEAVAVTGPLPHLVRTGRGAFVFFEGCGLPVAEVSVPLKGREIESSKRNASGNLLSPLPGKILEIRASVGQSVKAGDTICILESMKMEHPIKAPISGVLKQMCVAPQQVVEAGILVAEIAG